MNLVYFICNALYKDLLLLNLDFLYSCINREETHVLVLADKDLTFKQNETKPDFIHYLENFDYKYASKYEINKWSKVGEYENFLYLDADAIAVNDGVNKAFLAASNRKDVVHCVQEHHSINEVGHTHKCSCIDYPPNIIAYNAGTFAFNKNLLFHFDRLLAFIDLFKTKAIYDQPLFNEYFISAGAIEPTLSLITYLILEMNEDAKIGNAYIRKHNKELASIIHFLGNPYKEKPHKEIEKYLKKLGYTRKKKSRGLSSKAE